MNPKISIIAAMDEKRGIGKDNKIPWVLRADLRKLKSLTIENVVIIGRKSYESMSWYYDKSGRPMPAKLYLVVTRDEKYVPERDNAISANSLEEAIEKAKGFQKEEIFIIGGQQIFQQAISIADRLYLTVVKYAYESDAHFPDYTAFYKVISHEDGEENGLKYTFLILEK